MAAINIYVPETLHSQMKACGDISWSEVAQAAFASIVMRRAAISALPNDDLLQALVAAVSEEDKEAIYIAMLQQELQARLGTLRSE